MNAPRRFIDLHMHSSASDGAYAPAKLMNMAADRGLAAVALTDHDSVDGLAESARAAAERGLEFVPGIELAARHGRHEVHLLGLFIDPAQSTVLEALAGVRERRHVRNRAIIARLGSLGVRIDYDELARRMPHASIGRPHIADELVRLGTVHDRQQAFARFLGAGAAAYVPRELSSSGEVIALIHAAGGVAVVAHPGRLEHGSSLELETLIRALADRGLDGLEVIHSDHSPAQHELLGAIARRAGLALSGGSDFHRLPVRETRGAGFGGVKAPYEWLAGLAARRRGPPGAHSA